jgi:hypothetical protein
MGMMLQLEMMRLLHDVCVAVSVENLGVEEAQHLSSCC